MLYNRNIKWKSDFDIICNKLMKRDYKFSDHLLEQAINGDEKHNIPVNMLHYIIREVLRTNTIKPFEVEEINGYVNKFCVRVPFVMIEWILLLYLVLVLFSTLERHGSTVKVINILV